MNVKGGNMPDISCSSSVGLCDKLKMDKSFLDKSIGTSDIERTEND